MLSLIAFTLCLLAPQPAQPADIVVGMSAAFSGQSRALGIELYRGSMAYIEHVNQSDGVHGNRIVLKAYDDGYNPLPAMRNTLKLLDEDEAFVLMNYVGTPTVTRLLPLLKMHRHRSAYLFFPFSGALPQRLPPYDQYVFNLRASYQEEIERIVDHLLQLGRRNIGVLYQMDAYGRSGWEGARSSLAARGLSIVAEATYHRGAAYGDSQATQVRILRDAGADVVISIGSYAASAAFIRDARDAEWDAPIANISFVASDRMLGLLLETEAQTGRDYTHNLVISQVVPSYESDSLPAAREYRELMERYNPSPPAELTPADYRSSPLSTVGFEGFLNAKLLVEILRRLGPEPDNTRIAVTAEGIKNFDLGIDRRVSFDPYNHQGLNAVYFETVENDRLVPLSDWGSWLQ